MKQGPDRTDRRRTSDEAAGMDEDTCINAGDLRQLVVPETPPGFRECFPALEALRGDGNSLHAPLASGLVGVNNIYRLLGSSDG